MTRTILPFVLALLSFTAGARAQVAAVHTVGAAPWVELGEAAEPAEGRARIVQRESPTVLRSEIRGARLDARPVQLVGGLTACTGTLGRPVVLGMYDSMDSGYGSEPRWMRAAPVIGCRGAFSIAILGARAAPTRAAITVTQTQATTAAIEAAKRLVRSSPEMRELKGEHPGEVANIEASAFRLGTDTFALVQSTYDTECGGRSLVRAIVRRDAAGQITTMLAPTRDDDGSSVSALVDVDGNGALDLVLTGWFGSVDVLALEPTGTRRLFHGEATPFYGCSC